MKETTEYKISKGSSIALDFIRGVSAQLVVIGHGISFFGILKFMHEPNFPWMQNFAVLIFFLLSGFLITYSTARKMRKQSYSFGQYFIDRFSRIYTAFVPALLFVLVVDAISINIGYESYKYRDAYNLQSFIGNVLMLQDYPLFAVVKETVVTSFGSARVFWTLAIEWWIYLFFGYLSIVFINSRNRITWKNWLWLGFFSVVPLYNLVMGRGDGLTAYWLMGAAIYFLDRQDLLSRINRWMKLMFVVLLGGLGVVRAYWVMSAYDAVFAFILVMVLWLIIDLFREVNFSKRLERSIRFVAGYSYTLYLVHYSILFFIKTYYYDQYGGNPYLLCCLGFVLSNLISMLIGHFTENKLTPIIKRKMYNAYLQK